MSDTPTALRLDKWLWHARFFKTRSLAAKMVGEGAIRVNGARVTKPATSVRPGDGLTFVRADRLWVVRIRAIGARRGPASEAVLLYEDLTPTEAPAEKIPRTGPRPTKKDRRDLIAMRRGED